VPRLVSFVVRGLQSSFTGTQARTFKSKTAYRWQISRWCSVRSLVLLDSRTGQVTSLPGPPGPISDSGQIVSSQGVGVVGGMGNFHPDSYQNGVLQDLGTPPGTVGAQAVAVNAAGQVLVNAATIPGGFNHSYLGGAPGQLKNERNSRVRNDFRHVAPPN